jgi:ribosomal protein S27AE
LTVTNVLCAKISSRGCEQKTGMPTIELKVTSAPAGDTVGNHPPQGAGPLFRANGDIDYLCGNCGFVIASGISSAQRVPFDNATCPACGARNELPPGLRG